MKKTEVPQGKIVTYANRVCNYRPLKVKKYQVRLTIGGDKIQYEDETASPTADLLETFFLLNSTISDAHKGACFMEINIKIISS